jgi:hypothetical protein
MQQIPILTLTGIAAAAIVTQRFVNHTNAQGRNAQTAAGERALGVADHAATAGQNFPINVLGTAVVEAGAAFAAGVEVQSDAQGRAILKAAGATLGRALQPSAGAGSKVEILLIPG